MNIQPACRATAIGSFPYKTPGEALEDIFRCLVDIPVWPQLPARAFVEGMCPQYSEGIPAVKVDTKNEKISSDTGDALPGVMEKFYETYMSEALEPFDISEDYAPGFYEFIRQYKEKGTDYFAVKGHVTGPITFGLTVCDQNGRASYYDDMLKDGVVKGLGRKARRQAQLLKRLNPEVIIFIDEPYLQSFGSATVPLLYDDVVKSLDEVIADIHAAGASAGIHCCGNTDWSLIASTNVDIINFDAFEYAESLSLYAKQIFDYLERGGLLAWGVVPSTVAIDSQDINKLTGIFKDGVRLLEKKGIKENVILEQALITPTCGAGSLTPGQAVKMLDLTARLSRVLRGNKEKT